MRVTLTFSILIFGFVSRSHAFPFRGLEKVNIYVGHFLLQSWPQDKRVINMQVDTTLPPDTLVFQAIASDGGLKKTTLEIQDMQGNLIEEASRVTCLEDETEATFIYVLNPDNVRKVKGHRFRAILDVHQEKEEAHNVAIVVLGNWH